MSRPLLIHLIRHAHYDLLGTTLAGRTPGWHLSATGRGQASAVASALAGRAVTFVASSPLERAKETAEPIAQRFSLPVTILPELNEIDFGNWNGLTFSELDDRPDWRRFNSFRSWAPVPGGEPMLAAQMRGVTLIQRLAAEHGDGEIVLVTHGDMIRAVVAYVLGMPLDHLQRIVVAPASRTVVLANDTARLQCLNVQACEPE